MWLLTFVNSAVRETGFSSLSLTLPCAPTHYLVTGDKLKFIITHLSYGSFLFDGLPLRLLCFIDPLLGRP